MTLRLTLGYWGSSTLEIGLEVADDGHATGWQTGGTRVGRFARALTSAEQAALGEALASTSYEGGSGSAIGETPVAPSGAAEQLVGDALQVTFDPVSGPPAGLESLIAILTAIRDDLVTTPVAALELTVSGSPPTVRLLHVGREPIRVRADGPLGVEVATYDRHNALVDSEAHAVDVADLPAEVGPGWERTLLDHLRPTTPHSGWLSVSVSSLDVDAVGDGVLRRADLSWVSP